MNGVAEVRHGRASRAIMFQLHTRGGRECNNQFERHGKSFVCENFERKRKVDFEAILRSRSSFKRHANRANMPVLLHQLNAMFFYVYPSSDEISTSEATVFSWHDGRLCRIVVSLLSGFRFILSQIDRRPPELLAWWELADDGCRKNLNEFSRKSGSWTETHITDVAYVDDFVAFMTAERATELPNLAELILMMIVVMSNRMRRE